jgi:hypothetical protein
MKIAATTTTNGARAYLGFDTPTGMQ